MRFIDLTGCTFTHLRVVSLVTSRSRFSKVLWRCVCTCGRSTVVIAAHLRNGHTRSCGCLARDLLQQSRLTHGKSSSREYRIWYNLLNRCRNPKNAHYRYYGGRGILCRFRDFKHFYSELGDCPSGKTLDRIDVNGHYESGNVRWATPKEQMRNTRKNRWITFDNRTQTLAAWAEETGLSSVCIRDRLDRGWSIPQSLITPRVNHRSSRSRASCTRRSQLWPTRSARNTRNCSS